MLLNAPSLSQFIVDFRAYRDDFPLQEFHFWLNTFFVDSEFGFNGMTGLAHQVLPGAGNLSPVSNWTDASQLTSSAPPTANINDVQTQTLSFPSSGTNIPSNCTLHEGKETIDNQHLCGVVSNRSTVLKQPTTEEKIVEEPEKEDVINIEMQQCPRVGFVGQNTEKDPSDCELSQLHTNNIMHQEAMAPQLQSKVVIKNAEAENIRVSQKTEDQLQTQSDVCRSTEPTEVLTSKNDMNSQQTDVKNKEFSGSFQIGNEMHSECCGKNSIPTSSPPASPNCLSSEGKFQHSLLHKT